MTGSRRFILTDEQATQRLGEKLAAVLDRGDLVLLQGDLGAGKTALARAIIRTLAGAAIDVPSPTFILAAPYDLPRFPVVHYDLYRLDDPAEADELGLEDALDEGVALVEWPGILDGALTVDAIRIDLSGTEERLAELSAPSSFLERLDAS